MCVRVQRSNTPNASKGNTHTQNEKQTNKQTNSTSYMQSTHNTIAVCSGICYSLSAASFQTRFVKHFWRRKVIFLLTQLFWLFDCQNMKWNKRSFVRWFVSVSIWMCFGFLSFFVGLNQTGETPSSALDVWIGSKKEIVEMAEGEGRFVSLTNISFFFASAPAHPRTHVRPHMYVFNIHSAPFTIR